MALQESKQDFLFSAESTLTIASIVQRRLSSNIRGSWRMLHPSYKVLGILNVQLEPCGFIGPEPDAVQPSKTPGGLLIFPV